MQLVKATQPTMYFIGVTTGSSSIMKVFPDWAEALGIDAVLKGIDIPIHADPEVYREVVSFIKNDPLSVGALVTTHKIDIYSAAHDLFDAHLPLIRYEQQLGIGLAVRKHVLKRRGVITSDAQRKPGLALSNTARAEVDYLLQRLGRRDKRAAL